MTIGFNEYPVEPNTVELFDRARGWMVFCAPFPPPPPTPPVPATSPAMCTIRGGCEVVVISETALIDPSRDQTFLARVLPAGWATQVVGTGAVTISQARGLLFDTGRVGQSAAGVESTDMYLHGDMAVDFEILDTHESTFAAADLAVFEVTGTGAAARVRVRQGVGADPTQLIAFGDMTVGGVTTIGGVATWGGARGTLRIVRRGSRVFGFVGVREPGVPSVYSTLVKVLDASFFASDAGVIRFRVANLARGSRVRARFSNFTVRPHLTISGRLLVDKVEVGEHVIGLVPAATLEELGARELAVFGLFGEQVDADGFTYVLPVPLTVGLDATQTGITVQDPVLKDGV